MAAAPNPADTQTFLDGALDRFGGWVQYGDTKAGAVLVVLGLGLSNLVDNAGPLMNTSGWAEVATGAFAGSFAAAFLAVVFFGASVLPYAPSSSEDPQRASLMYYRTVAAKGTSAESYWKTVSGMAIEELNRHRALEAYALATIAENKAKWNKLALAFSGLFLLLWPAARVALAIAS